MEKLNLLTEITNILYKNNIDVTILHGVHNANIGRDVDVWIKKKDWGKTKKPIQLISEKLNYKLSIVNSPFGLRFLFFKENHDQCGFFEFHIVNNLNWFYLSHPKSDKALSTHKRFTMPLLAKNIEKLHDELNNHPLSSEEIKSLYNHLSINEKILTKKEFDIFINYINTKQILNAHILLKNKTIKNTLKHPLTVLIYILRKIQTFIWLFFSISGLVVLALGDFDYKNYVDLISEKKGILTKISYKDFRKTNFLSLLILCIKQRQKQGQQQATIIHISPKQLWIKHLFVKPILIDFLDYDITKTMNQALYTITNNSNHI